MNGYESSGRDEKASCYYGCGTTEHLRPYGPGGAPICFPCMKAAPERERQAEQAFSAQLDASQAISDIGSAVLSAERPVEPFMSTDVPR